MTKYTLKFRYAHENRYLYIPLSSETLEKAIEETKYFIEDMKQLGRETSEAYIEKHIESKEIVWGLENV